MPEAALNPEGGNKKKKDVDLDFVFTFSVVFFDNGTWNGRSYKEGDKLEQTSRYSAPSEHEARRKLVGASMSNNARVTSITLLP